MKNKGFTLIELLAVIVVLAIIALIATPIVLNIIGNTKENADDRSSEFYLNAVEQAVTRKNLTEEFNPTTCEIQSDGNLICDGDTLLEVQVENTKPTSGTITFEDGRIIGYKFTLGSKENVKLVPTEESCFETEDVTGGVSITAYNCGESSKNEILDVVIPNTINGKKVVTIGSKAFYSKGLKSVIIPDGVTLIADQSFRDNKLTNIDIPDSVTIISLGAFMSNKLTSVEIPNSVKLINGQAFWGNQLTSVIIPASVTDIGYLAFMNNKLTSVIIPTSVTSIGYGAFRGNQLTSVTIKGKTSMSDFKSFGDGVFGWADGYSDSNITFES